MNTEINFLEKKQNKYTAFLWFGIAFFLLLLIAISILLYQKNQYTTEIEALDERKAQIEVALIDLQKEYSGKRELEQLQQDIELMQSEMMPVIPLYYDILDSLDTEQMSNYDFAGEGQVVVQTEFATLDDVANYISSLNEQAYIIDTQLTSVSQVESTYQATLTIIIEQDTLLEEFETHD